MRAVWVALVVKNPPANAGETRENSVMHETHRMYLEKVTFLF